MIFPKIKTAGVKPMATEVKVYCAHTKKTVCKLGALKPDHGMNLWGICYRAAYLIRKGWLFFIVITYNITILSGFLISYLVNSSSIAYHFQEHKQEMIQVKLTLKNKVS